MESNPPPPRLSKAYVLGLSSKPWKDPPKPPPLNSWKGMMETPGAALEWVASDGRRGTLVEKGKMRLGFPSGAAVDSKGSSGPGTVSRIAAKGFTKIDGEDAKSEKEANKYTSGQANDASELEYKKVPSDAWTDDQDKGLFRMKVAQKPWGEITKELGKTKQECQARWRAIMPDGFYNHQNKGGDKGGDKGKHDKGTDKKQKQEGQNKAEPEVSSGGDTLGGISWDIFATPEDNKPNASGENTKNNAVVNTAGGGADTGGTPGWDKSDNSGGADTWNAGDNNNIGAADDPWNVGNDNDDTNEKNKNGGNGMKPPENGGQNESKKQDSTSGGKEWADNNNWENAGGGSGADKAPVWGRGENNDLKSNGKVDKDNGGRDWGTDNSNDNNNDSGDYGNNGNDRASGQSWGGDNNGTGTSSTWNKHAGDKGGGEACHNGNDDRTWRGAASPKKSSSRCGSKDHKKHRSEERSFRRDSESKNKHKSHHHHGRSHQAEYKVAPDDTFSQDELKLVARILQQDSFMVWERVSWRFKDKTGRYLDPDVFEKKITGRVEKEQH